MTTDDSRKQRVRPTRIRKKTRKVWDVKYVCGDVFDDASELSLEEALQGAEKDLKRKERLKAVKEELQCFEDNIAWELVG